MSAGDNVEGSKKRGRPPVIYALVLLQVVVVFLMIEGVQGLFIPSTNGSTDGLSFGFPLAIINLMLIAAVWSGRRWGRSSIAAFALVGAVVCILGSVQAYLDHLLSTAITVGPDLPVIPLVVELAVLYLVLQPGSRAYFAR